MSEARDHGFHKSSKKGDEMRLMSSNGLKKEKDLGDTLVNLYL